MSARKKAGQPDTRKHQQREIFPLEVEHLLDVFAQIEARRQIRLRIAEKESLNATSKIPS